MYWNTVSTNLKLVLEALMDNPLFNPFRLVGGTALSLQIGHRMSVDIDLFTDESYGSIDFASIDQFLRNNYPYAVTNGSSVGGGTSYFLGNSEEDAIKLDLYYTDDFFQPLMEQDEIRMATIEEIIAMKLEIISGIGRKKDFWDLHALSDNYSLRDMLRFYESRYPYSHDSGQIRKNIINFSSADDDLDPICLQGKFWELIKYDIVNWAS